MIRTTRDNMEQQGKTRGDNKGPLVMTKDLKDTRTSKGTSTENKGQQGDN
jgi:hypothetical protein